MLWSAGAWLLRTTANVHGPGVSVLMHIPGMKTLTATPNWTPGWRQEQDAQLPVVAAAGDGSGAAAAAGRVDSKDVQMGLPGSSSAAAGAAAKS